jgi:hypothetical protein
VQPTSHQAFENGRFISRWVLQCQHPQHHQLLQGLQRGTAAEAANAQLAGQHISRQQAMALIAALQLQGCESGEVAEIKLCSASCVAGKYTG